MTSVHALALALALSVQPASPSDQRVAARAAAARLPLSCAARRAAAARQPRARIQHPSTPGRTARRNSYRSASTRSTSCAVKSRAAATLRGRPTTTAALPRRRRPPAHRARRRRQHLPRDRRHLAPGAAHAAPLARAGGAGARRARRVDDVAARAAAPRARGPLHVDRRGVRGRARRIERTERGEAAAAALERATGAMVEHAPRHAPPVPPRAPSRADALVSHLHRRRPVEATAVCSTLCSTRGKRLLPAAAVPRDDAAPGPRARAAQRRDRRDHRRGAADAAALRERRRPLLRAIALRGERVAAARARHAPAEGGARGDGGLGELRVPVCRARTAVPRRRVSRAAGGGGAGLARGDACEGGGAAEGEGGADGAGVARDLRSCDEPV